jgi:hypothetical protein
VSICGQSTFWPVTDPVPPGADYGHGTGCDRPVCQETGKASASFMLIIRLGTLSVYAAFADQQAACNRHCHERPNSTG